MSTDPNGNRWSSSDKNFGKALLKKSGWTEGSGLGKDQDGVAAPVKVRRKDDTMGLGYQAGVQEVWTTQSVGFADVLARIKSSAAAAPLKDSAENSDRDDEATGTSPTSTRVATQKMGESRHYKMYAKRNALKTELLRTSSADASFKSGEILGSASSHRRRHGREGSATSALSSGDDEIDASGRHESSRSAKRAKEERSAASTLKSPLLSRLMVRNAKHEPVPSCDTMTAAERVRITKPHPRPARCTDTPFLA